MTPEESRRAQCPYRTTIGTCVRVNDSLGFSPALPLSECNLCWKSGIDTEDARRIRDDYVQLTIARARRWGHKCSHRTLVALIDRHLSVEDAESLLLQVATKIGDDEALSLADRLEARSSVHS